MINNTRQAIARRDDISRFVVHLTKDSDDETAEENLISILNDKTIFAKNHFCLFSRKLREEINPCEQNKFNAVAFTETPLNQIHNLIDVENRRIKLKPYGIIFAKSIVETYGANPCFYLYEKNFTLIKYFFEQFNESKRKAFDTEFCKFGALITKFGISMDFSWEREWRIVGDCHFDYENIFAIVSENEDIDLPEACENIPILNPKWGFEEMISKLARLSTRR